MSLQLLQGGQDVITVVTKGQDASYTYKGSRCHYSCYKGVKMSLQLLQRVKMLVTLTKGQDAISCYSKYRKELGCYKGSDIICCYRGQDVISSEKGSKCHDFLQGVKTSPVCRLHAGRGNIPFPHSHGLPEIKTKPRTAQ